MRKLTKIFLVLVAICGLISCSNQKEERNDWAKENFKGDVRSLKETKYQAIIRSGEVETGNSCNIWTSDYDEKGHLISETGYNSYDYFTTKFMYEYKYNEEGRLTNRYECFRTIHANANGKNANKKDEYYSVDLVCRTYTYKYDEYNEEGDWVKKISFISDTSGNTTPEYVWIREYVYY